MNLSDLLTRARASIPSDNSLAKTIGCERATVSAWRRGIAAPSDVLALKLAVLAAVPAPVALVVCAAARSPAPDEWRGAVEAVERVFSGSEGGGSGSGNAITEEYILC